MQDCTDGSVLQFIKFDFVTGGQEIKIAILLKTMLNVCECMLAVFVICSTSVIPPLWFDSSLTTYTKVQSF